MNTLRTILLMGFLTALMVAVGGFLGGRNGLVIAFLIALATNFYGYWFSDKMALSQSGAVPVSREEAPELYDIVEGLCSKAGLPMPAIYMTPDESPNAFATGRDPEHSAVAVTAGILRILNRNELEAVLAHELGHVRNRDILITSIAAVFASVITFIAQWGYYLPGGEDEERSMHPIFALILMLLAPLAALIVNMAISRSREYQADASGAQLCGHPEALANALSKLQQGTQTRPGSVNPALGNLYTVKPDPGNWLTNLLSTHPPIPERIARLEEMAVHQHTL